MVINVSLQYRHFKTLFRSCKVFNGIPFSATFQVDLSQLQPATLRRYKRHYRIPTRPGMSKSQLIEVSGMMED